MRKFLVPVLAMVVGAASGGLAVQGLHAQAKPPVYQVSLIDVTDMDAYLKDYLPKMEAVNKTGGGKILAASAKITLLTGASAPHRVGIVQWESVEQLQAARNTPEFRTAHAIGEKYATFHEFAVEGRPSER